MQNVTAFVAVGIGIVVEEGCGRECQRAAERIDKFVIIGDWSVICRERCCGGHCGEFSSVPSATRSEFETLNVWASCREIVLDGQAAAVGKGQR